MDDNSLLVIILAFILGCMCSGMMKQMCGRRRLVEGFMDWLTAIKAGYPCGSANDVGGEDCGPFYSCQSNGECH